MTNLPVLNQRRRLSYALAGVLLLWVWSYRSTLLSIVEKWDTDASFSHGFLILPIVLWLVWRRRTELGAVPFQPSWTGATAVLGCAGAWAVAKGSGVLVIEQLAAVAMVPALVLALLGWAAVRLIAFPLGYMLLMVPFGRGIVPGLMQATADIATALLQWTGVPVLRTHMYLTIPAGDFEVARACSGLNYFTTGLVLGLLYTYLNFRGWWKRLVWAAVFAVLPVLLNGVRVYIIVLVSYLTDMRFGPGAEHIMFGRVFFVIVIVALFWIGRRWHDDPVAAPARMATEVDCRPGAAGSIAAAVAFCVMLVTPMLFGWAVSRTRTELLAADSLLRMPAAAPGWQGPWDGTGRWRPMYTGGLVEKLVWYRSPQGGELEAFTAVYGLGATVGAEMISYGNLLFPEERGSLAVDRLRVVETPAGGSFRVREVVVSYGESRRLVWQWFVVGRRPVLGAFATKSVEALAFMTRSAHSERIVTLATPLDGGSQARLQDFIDAYGRCAEQGFQPEACGG